MVLGAHLGAQPLLAPKAHLAAQRHLGAQRHLTPSPAFCPRIDTNLHQSQAMGVERLRSCEVERYQFFDFPFVSIREDSWTNPILSTSQRSKCLFTD